MTQPSANDIHLYSRLEEMHGSRMTKNMWAEPFRIDRPQSGRDPSAIFARQIVDTKASEWLIPTIDKNR